MSVRVQQICADCKELFDLKPDQKKSTTTLCPECKPERYQLIQEDGKIAFFQVVRKMRWIGPKK